MRSRNAQPTAFMKPLIRWLWKACKFALVVFALFYGVLFVFGGEDVGARGVCLIMFLLFWEQNLRIRRIEQRLIAAAITGNTASQPPQ